LQVIFVAANGGKRSSSSRDDIINFVSI